MSAPEPDSFPEFYKMMEGARAFLALAAKFETAYTGDSELTGEAAQVTKPQRVFMHAAVALLDSQDFEQDEALEITACLAGLVFGNTLEGCETDKGRRAAVQLFAMTVGSSSATAAQALREFMQRPEAVPQ